MERLCLYIDKENIKSIVQSKDKMVFDDCVRMIRRNIDVHYNFSREDAIKDPYINFWFRSIAGQDVKNMFKFSKSPSDIIPERPFSLASFMLDGNENPFGIYLINDSVASHNIASHNCVLMGSIGEELDIIQELLELNERDEVFAKNIKWQNFCPTLPLTDILLCDNYYFKDKNVYQSNNNSLLMVLSSMPKKFPVNVVIITRNSDISPYINLNEEVDNIKEMVQEASDNVNSTVTIVGVKNDVHDRVLITNYYRINSSAGFQKQKRVKEDIRCEIKAHSRGSNYQISMSLIEDSYQKAVNSCVFCLGDKKSNYLEF